MRKEQLDNLTKGTRPALHPSAPHWDTLKGLVERATDSLADAKKKANSSPTRFAAAYSAAFWLARAALEACGYRLAGSVGHRVAVFQNLANTLEWDASRWRRLDDLHKFRNRFDYGDLVEVSEQQLATAIVGAQDLLDDVLRVFPHIKP
jgi:uncharacterized protein (UPF0332 family)